MLFSREKTRRRTRCKVELIKERATVQKGGRGDTMSNKLLRTHQKTRAELGNRRVSERKEKGKKFLA